MLHLLFVTTLFLAEPLPCTNTINVQQQAIVVTLPWSCFLFLHVSLWCCLCRSRFLHAFVPSVWCYAFLFFLPSIFLLYNVHYKEQYTKADDSSGHIICRSCPLRTCSSKKTNKTSDSLAPTRSPFCRKLVSRRAWRTQFYIAAPPFLPEPPALE